MADEFDPYSKGVEYQVTKVDPTDPTTKGAVYQVHKVDEVTAAMSGKFYRARVIKDPSDPTVMGKVYQIVIIDDPDDPSVKGKVYNAIITGDQEAIVVCRAVPPLDLDSAVADTLAYVKAYGGLLQSGVPSGYTAVEYVQNATKTLVPTDFVPVGVTSVKVDLMTTVSLPSTATGRTFYIFQARETTAATIFGISGAQSSLAISGSGTNNAITSSITRTNGNKYRIVWEATNGTQTLTVDDLTAETTDTKTNTYTTIADVNSPMCLFGNAGTLDPSGTATEANRIYQGAQVYYAKMWANGKLVLDLVPAKRNSDNAVGFYNKVNGVFFTASEGSLTAGNEIVPTPSGPMDIYCNNGALKILDKSAWTTFTNPTSVAGQGVFISSDGKWYNANDRGAGCAIPLTIGKQYTLVIHKKTADLGTILRYGQSPQETPTGAGIQLTDWYRGDITDGQMISFVAKLPYLVMQLSANAVEAGMIQEAIEVLEAQGGEVLKLTPSNDTAGVANLLKIASDADTHEILTGAINHKIGIRVLDGTEDWSAQTGGGATWYEASLLDTNMFSHLVCTHFVNAPVALNNDAVYKSAGSAVLQIRYDTASDLAAFKSWLATQYSAGTPVIVVYGLETPQDEVSPVPQTMQTVAGDNVLEIVQAGMSGLEVEVQYTKEG